MGSATLYTIPDETLAPAFSYLPVPHSQRTLVESIEFIHFIFSSLISHKFEIKLASTYYKLQS
jgi:hypothetical protein